MKTSVAWSKGNTGKPAVDEGSSPMRGPLGYIRIRERRVTIIVQGCLAVVVTPPAHTHTITLHKPTDGSGAWLKHYQKK